MPSKIKKYLLLTSYYNYFIGKKKFYFKLIYYFIKKPLQIKYLYLWVKSKNKSGATIKYQLPWIPFNAICWLDKKLLLNINVFEWGSGGSTLFITKKIKSLVSVEHNKNWYKIMQTKLKNKNLKNCSYNLVEDPRLYYQFINKYPDEFFDIIIIDGIERESCIEQSILKIKKGGYIILDNSERPEYSSGIKKLNEFERKDFCGPGLQNKYFWKTTIFKK